MLLATAVCALKLPPRYHADPAWVERYGRWARGYDVPQGEAKRRAYAEQIGGDGYQLLAALSVPGAPAWLREIPAVELLRQVWTQNFGLIDDAPTAGPEVGAPGEAARLVQWRTDQEGLAPSLLMAASPYDPEVHNARKRATTWIAYMVHLTETCDEGRPHLITHVETTPAPIVDRDALEQIHAALDAKGLLPSTHLVDAGYVAADQLVDSRRDYDVTLLGWAPKDYQWQAQSGRASPYRTSSSTGIGKWRSVRPGTRAGAGFRITGRDGLPSRFASRRPTVVPVR